MKIVDLNDGNLNLPPIERVEPEEKPPIAVDFTDNPFSEVDPVAIPSDDEKQDVWESMRKRFKLVREEAKKGGELDGGKIKLVEDGSTMAANVLSAVLGLLFALLGEEYTVLAPTQDLAYKMIMPAARIWARHSKIAGEISPDYVDASACLAAVAEYTRTVMKGIREINWMKANGYVYVGEQAATRYEQANTRGEQATGAGAGNYERVTSEERAPYESFASQNGANGSAARQSPIGGYPAGSPATRTSLGTVGAVVNEGLTDEQRRAYSKLLELRERDINARKRRAGKL